MRRLPPLKSLRAFEAAARHLSFTKAADELSVTLGAVSQQVKVLEDYLGHRLFKRENRKIILTEEAENFVPYITDGLDKLAEGVGIFHEDKTSKPLIITIPPTLAAGWLMPRLNRFKKLHPEIDVQVDANNDLVDLVNDDVDVGIRFGEGDYPGLDSDFLFSQTVFPVCSPELLTKEPKLDKPEDLKNHTLLHGAYYSNSTIRVDWDMWLAIVGIDDIDTSHGMHFSQQNLVAQAALDGQGIALAGDVAASNDIKKGRLVKLFEPGIPLEFSYYFICSKAKSRQPRIQLFRKWLLDEVESMND